MLYTLLTAAMDFLQLRETTNENFRTSPFVNKALKTALFTIWTDDTSGSLIDVYYCTGTYAATLVAATDTDAAAGRTVTIKNNGAGTITITRDGTDTIEGATTLALAAGAYATLLSDGTSDWMQLG